MQPEKEDRISSELSAGGQVIPTPSLLLNPPMTVKIHYTSPD